MLKKLLTILIVLFLVITVPSLLIDDNINTSEYNKNPDNISEEIIVSFYNQNTIIGNGIAIENDKILTACHLKNNLPNKFKIKHKNKTYTAQIKKYNKKTDLALVKPNKKLNLSLKPKFENINSKTTLYSTKKNQEKINTKKVKNQKIIGLENKTYYTYLKDKAQKGYSGGPAIGENGKINGIISFVYKTNKKSNTIIINSKNIKKFLNNNYTYQEQNFKLPNNKRLC